MPLAAYHLMRVVMNWIDLALALLMIVPVVAGILVGFDRAVIGLAATIRFTPHGYRAASLRLRPRIPQTQVANFGAGAMLAPLDRSTLIWSKCAIGVLGAVRCGCGPPIHHALAGTK